MQNVIDILEERGIVDALTSDELREIVMKPIKVYCGFDPTADSLHIGHLVAIMGLAWFQRCGHTPFVIVGGATGMIGDPSWKSTERKLLDEETIQKNLVGIRKNFESILDFKQTANPPVLLNNYDWFKEFSFVTFLRDVGKHFRMGTMLTKDSVKARLNSEDGMSFTEFSYQLLQGYDFLYLNQKYGVTLQIGGSDQWGNITAGIDLVRKVKGDSVYGMTFPLLTKSDGQKFGKTEKGAVWLSPERLSPYEFYQYLYRTTDADVINLMRMLTFMPMPEITSYAEQMQSQNYVPNTAQKRLAEEVTRIVHGEEGLRIAQKVTEAAAPGASTQLNSTTLESLATTIPCYTLSKTDFLQSLLVEVIVKLGIQPSKGEVRRLIKNGGLYLNNDPVKEENYVLGPKDLVEERMILIGLGKKNKVLVRLTD